MAMYELKDPNDKSTYALVEISGKALSQGDVDSVIGHLTSQGMEDWNVDDICEELSRRGFDVTMLDVPEEIWI